MNHITLTNTSDFAHLPSDTIYDIADEISLGGATFTPTRCVLNFIGGCLKGGTITGDNTVINAPAIRIFGENITLGGSWVNNECYPEWFDFDESDATPSIQAALDSPFPEVKISGRTYFCKSFSYSHTHNNNIVNAVLVLRQITSKFKKISGSATTSWYGTGSHLIYLPDIIVERDQDDNTKNYFLIAETGDYTINDETGQTSCFISNVKFDGRGILDIIFGSLPGDYDPLYNIYNQGIDFEHFYCREIGIESCQFINSKEYSVSLACWDCVMTDVFCSSALRLYGGAEGLPHVGTLTTTTLTNVVARNFIISGYTATVELIGCTADGKYGDCESTRFNAPYAFHLYGGQITMMGCYTEDFAKVLKLEMANLANIINCQFNCRQAAGDAKTDAVLVRLENSHDVTFINTKLPDCYLCNNPLHAYRVYDMVRCLFINCVINNRGNSSLFDRPLLPENLWVFIGDEPAVINGYRKSGTIDLVSLFDSLSANVVSLEIDANSTDSFIVDNIQYTLTNNTPERVIKTINIPTGSASFNLYNIRSRVIYLPEISMTKLKVDQCAKNQDLSFLDAPLLTDIEALFSHSAATELTLGFNSSNILHMHRLFEQCSNLKTVHFGDSWDCQNALYHVNNLFDGCSELKYITGTISNLGKKFMNDVMVDLSPCPLTRESALIIINGLYDITTHGSPTGLSVKFNYDTYELLTPADLAIITSKGWTYSSAPQLNTTT